jgi:hypothetical protein
MRHHTSSTTNRLPVEQEDAKSTADRPAEASQRESDERALWAMTAEERVTAMWRSELTLQQLARWSSHAPKEVPLLGGEFAWIAMRTPEWADAARQHQSAA